MHKGGPAAQSYVACARDASGAMIAASREMGHH
jgi:hypothetical protein